MIVDVEMGRPDMSLRPVVERYVGYRMEGFRPAIHRGLPSRELTFIVSLGDPVEISASPDPARPRTAMQAFVGGLHTSAAAIHHDGNQYGIAVELTPLGAHAVFGMPAGELTGQVVPLGDLLGGRACELTERLAEARAWKHRFAVMDDVLARGRSERTVPPEVMHAWERLVRRAEPLDVRMLADEVGWSRRHLSERFRREIGLPPRQLARVVRLQRSRRLLTLGDRSTMTAVATDSGYYDHAHMLHEWRSLAGCTPAEWLREELPSIQDDVGADVPE